MIIIIIIKNNTVTLLYRRLKVLYSIMNILELIILLCKIQLIKILLFTLGMIVDKITKNKECWMKIEPHLLKFKVPKLIDSEFDKGLPLSLKDGFIIHFELIFCNKYVWWHYV